jgi:hypothetical protein
LTLLSLHRYDSWTLVIMDVTMIELNDLLRPVWGAEKWILEGWNKINAEEKAVIKERMDDLFKDGLPFEIQHDNLLYIYTFSLLAQLEVLAIQVPLRFESQMPNVEFQQRMRAQLLDEIFHGMVFTKIVYLLSAPYAQPPAYDEQIEELCNFIRNEDCPKMGLVLLNLVAEGWIEEVFKSLHQQGIAQKVFAVILDDEHRHVSEADLYRSIGLPPEELLNKKLPLLEGLLLSSINFQSKYSMALYYLLGHASAQAFIHNLNEKHIQQLKKIQLVPSRTWQLLCHVAQESLEKLQWPQRQVEMTPVRKYFMTQWHGTGDPTMVSQFNLDVSCLDFFAKKYPVEALTGLMMQTVSQVLSQEDSFRNFLNFNQLYQSANANVAVVVKLPDCGDQIASIIFKDCHQMSVADLSIRIRQVVQMMAYCYKKREELDKTCPHLKQEWDAGMFEAAHDIYPYPEMGSFMVSISSIGFCGYSQAVSPLRKNESLKVTLLAVERKPVWNKTTQAFEPRDLLPVSISADHRIFDGNLPIPKLLDQSFHAMFNNMCTTQQAPIPAQVPLRSNFVRAIDKMVNENAEMAYRILARLQHVWFDFISIEEIYDNVAKKMARKRLEEWMF